MNIYDSWHRNYYSESPEREVFIDITHNALGVLCEVYYNPETKSYKFKPIGEKGKKEIIDMLEYLKSQVEDYFERIKSPY